MKKSLICSLLLLTVLASCGGKKSQPVRAEQDTTTIADTTLYGTSTEDFGMSTFSMVTDKGDTLCVSRTSNDGTYAQIYGSVSYGDRYAMITTDGGEAMSLLVNLSELDKKLKDYDIVNGKLIVAGDTVAWEKYFQK